MLTSVGGNLFHQIWLLKTLPSLTLSTCNRSCTTSLDKLFVVSPLQCKKYLPYVQSKSISFQFKTVSLQTLIKSLSPFFFQAPFKFLEDLGMHFIRFHGLMYLQVRQMVLNLSLYCRGQFFILPVPTFASCEWSSVSGALGQ